MGEGVTAAVQTGERQIEVRSLPRPTEVADDEALLAVEGNGMCGTDWEQYKGRLAGIAPWPLIPGHETVGRIVAAGDVALARMGVPVGTRVAVESTVPCEVCTNCRRGRFLFCTDRRIYGLTPMADAPELSGGYADLLVLRPHTRVYALPEHLSVEDAVFFNPLGSGFDWAVRIPGTVVGDTVVILGPGQRGLSSVIAAKEAGAGKVVVVGRGRRPWKLELAKTLGATHVVDSDAVDAVEAVRDITGGDLADRVVDTTPLAVQPMLDAVAMARAEGTVVLAALKEHVGAPGLTDLITSKALTVKGAHSVSEWAKHQAIRVLGEGRYDLSAVHTHTFPVERLDHAMRVLGGEVDGEEALHITVTANT
jgi:threonine dehydrogenase-like Zn-dependent dehydrogenase